MTTEYPYMISNNKIKQIFDKIESAEKPQKFSHSVLKKLGFSSSNDRAIIPLLKRLGFLRDDGVPTELYDDLKDKTKRFHILADRIKVLYSDLFSIDTNIQEASENEIKGAISRVTGKDSSTVNRYYSTFKTLTQIADFSDIPISTNNSDNDTEKETMTIQNSTKVKNSSVAPSFHYNIQIHLPATTDISVYNAIFKSLKENLGV